MGGRSQEKKSRSRGAGFARKGLPHFNHQRKAKTAWTTRRISVKKQGCVRTQYGLKAHSNHSEWRRNSALLFPLIMGKRSGERLVSAASFTTKETRRFRCVCPFHPSKSESFSGECLAQPVLRDNTRRFRCVIRVYVHKRLPVQSFQESSVRWRDLISV